MMCPELVEGRALRQAQRACGGRAGELSAHVGSGAGELSACGVGRWRAQRAFDRARASSAVRAAANRVESEATPMNVHP